MSKLLVFAAPSGAGKTTIVNHLLSKYKSLAFSVSATTRKKRAHEINGKHYCFLTVDQFKEHIKHGDFVEWQEVYKDQFYGTLKKEIQRLWDEGKNIIFDIDVKGALNIKNQYPDESYLVFVKPPSLQTLADRLTNRNTESAESLKKRMEKARKELSYESLFDDVVLNDNLEDAFRRAEAICDKLGI